MNNKIKGSSLSTEILKRLLIYGLLTLFLGSLQCAFFPLLDFCPKTPDLILAMLVAIALLDSELAAGVCAVVCGFFIDAVGSTGLAISPLIYFLTVVIVCCFTGKILKSFPSFLILLVPTLICRALATYIRIIIAEGFPEPWVITEIILPELLITALFAMPIYFLVKLCIKPLKSHSKFTF